MYGTSWGGFNSLQVAMERPPALHAIVPIYASDDRYTDDVHYMGGILKAIDLVDWVIYMAAGNVLPPVPAVYGDGWREEWRRRIEGTEPWLLRWLEEQDDGPYWRHGSLRPDYERIACPTMIVAGWADGYTNIALRAYEAMTCPRRVIIGPWSARVDGDVDPRAAHRPRPRAHPLVLALAARRAKRHRRGAADRSLRAPLDASGARSRRDARRVALGADVAARATAPERRGDPTATADRIAVRGDVGTAAWISCAGKPPWTLPDDQREDDARSLTYDWPPLDDELEILGHPRLRRHRHVAASRRVPVGAALRRLPRRDVGAREPRRAQPHAPRRPRCPEAARAGRSDAGRARARGDVVDLRAGPSRAARARRRRTGRTRGRRHSAGSLRVERAQRRARAARPRRPARRGGTRLPATTTGERGRDEPTTEQPPVVRRIEHDPVGRADAVVTSYGYRYEGRTTRRSRSSTTGSSASRTATRAARGRARVRATRSPGRRPTCGPRPTSDSAPTLEPVPRRRRGRRLGGRAGRHRPRRAPLRAHDSAPPAVAHAA